jgi:asparagine synthase (glutamine-hydrolysing)
MSGVAGWAHFAGDPAHARGLVEHMVRTLTHRGPDAHGVWAAAGVAIGQARLAAIGSASAAQPTVVGADGDPGVVVSSSGAVYNLAPLRRELEGYGYRFRTDADAEVIGAAYLRWGAGCVARLDGMFAFALWDVRRRELLLARDRLGLKPLCYARTGDGVVFGSEPKALLAHPLVTPVVDADGLREMFSTAHTPGATVYRDIREVRPACFVVVDGAGTTEHRYWTLTARTHTEDLPATVATVRGMLEDIVARQLVSDVPLCTLLSGGLDSSAVTALAALALSARGSGPVRSLTATFTGYSENFQPDLVRATPDAPYARALADHVGARHIDVELNSAELADPAAKFACLRAADMPTPFGDMDTAGLLAFRAAREHSVVALSGGVADELFGGHSWIHITDLVDRPMFPWVSFEQWHPGTAQGLGRALFDRGLLDKLDMPAYYADRYAEAIATVPYPDGPPEPAIQRRMREICYLDLTRWLPRLLDRNDRLAMAGGLEVRVPFSDHALVEYLYNTPWEYKTFDGREKGLLRAAVADLLPDMVLEREKSPFPVTQDPAYTRTLHAELAAVLADPEAPVRPLLDVAAAEQALRVPDEHTNDWLSRMNLEMVLKVDQWLRAYHVQLML